MGYSRSGELRRRDDEFPTLPTPGPVSGETSDKYFSYSHLVLALVLVLHSLSQESNWELCDYLHLRSYVVVEKFV